ncbi:PREDICTED: programmed cell death protein 2-like [Rhagoletis zephyria]|uniref:programmed cell death protein 2-like n=1 Tax=Rhagoletis zephyria TaxID=28612 RepID=UPI000811A540|nr:PREDICTED: programmed cell death protein 2-like [Rhagoletis zephyria]
MESPIFIGVVDSEEINSSHWTDNKIGGSPVFSSKAVFREQFNCSSCSQSTAFVFQISCPVDNTTNDRVLYFFACVNQKCSKKEYSVFRVLTEHMQQKQSKAKANENLFEDAWGISNDDKNGNDKNGNLNDDFDRCLSLNENEKPEEKNTFFKSYYISVFEEPHKEWKINQNEKKNLENLAKACLEEQNVQGEGYEKQYTNAFREDAINYHFYKRLRRCPEQIIRYDWAGQPLLSSADAEPKAEPCPECGAARVFELQLMPALISILCRAKLPHITSPIDLDFETILVYSCVNNCNSKAGVTTHKEQSIVFKERFKDDKVVETSN